jgi:small subunit ribosomal protein S21
MLVVKVGDSIEKALKQWKKKFDSTKTLRELRERTQFEKNQ